MDRSLGGSTTADTIQTSIGAIQRIGNSATSSFGDGRSSEPSRQRQADE
jgi:hypothetical protein